MNGQLLSVELTNLVILPRHGRFARLLCSTQQAKPFRPLQEQLHRGGLPACPPTGRALAHCLQPGADRLKRDVGVRALDGGDDGGQAVVGFAAAGAVQYRGR